MRRLVVLVAMGALAWAASGAPAASAPDTKQMVLRLQDAPTGFERTRGRYVSNQQAAAETKIRKDYAKLGRITGYEVTLKKSGVSGVLQITSSSSTYKTPRGAHDSWLASLAGAESATPRPRRLALGGSLGHDARLYKTTVTNDGTKVDVISLVWRYKSVFSAVIAGGVSGTFGPTAVVALGRKQQARIRSAVG